MSFLSGFSPELKARLVEKAAKYKEESRMNWNSVKDSLPNRYTEVFIYPRPEYSGVQYVGEYGLIKGKTEPVWYCSVYENGWGWETEEIQVTHWMYIPEDPQE